MHELVAQTRDFCDYAAGKLDESLAIVSKCLHLLSIEQIWQRPNDVSNAIGNLVLHLRGNVQAWIVSTLGGTPFERNRPAEFAQRDPLPTKRILGELSETVADARRVLAELTPERLARRHAIGRFDVTGQGAVFHAVEHFSLHTGQIVYATKLLLGCDLSQFDALGRRLAGPDAGGP